MLKLDLKLKPGPAGLEQLQHWPDREFTPDFIVAASGTARFEFDGRPVVSSGGRLSLAAARSTQPTEGLPDYMGGFALNLGKAAAGLKKNPAAGSGASARFIDEPLELHLAWLESGQIEASLRQDGQPIARLVTPAGPQLAEIGRALQAFYVQLLEINPRLAAQPDLRTLNRLVIEIIAA